ncbi:hypothetical protein Q7C36_010560 [Tachysurus vachellii]|uniref:Uncharacterized protein n=1 Tax=Tachysurus vachellii TaxID=175792 RepID=A0AA88MUS5_TACVA|nr:hypothetical protein Q7C36_010560 [Tachysurus vachellii]
MAQEPLHWIEMELGILDLHKLQAPSWREGKVPAAGTESLIMVTKPKSIEWLGSHVSSSCLQNLTQTL